MLTQSIEAVIYYAHDPDEVAGLNAAIIAMADHLTAVSTASERSKIRQILSGSHFRYGQAVRMRTLLLRASRHARANLNEYFPTMRESIMDSAERLELAIDLYWDAFTADIALAIPIR